MSDPRNREYTNGEITVFWKPSKCIHATTCFRELLEVFNPGRRPWVNMEGASTRKIIEVVNKCPTQALTWKYNSDLSADKEASIRQQPRVKDEETPETLTDTEEKPKPTSIKIMKNGPIIVEGEFRIIGPDGNEMKTMKMTSFCRCGHSKSMPFCDGSHRKVDFRDR
ncbi:MAG: (4Fe-4S)-binding protein [Bacteroidales bacterium]